MFERLDELIDKNLKLIFESKSQSSIRLYDLDNKSYNNNDTKRLAKIMQGKELVFATERKCDIAPFGLEVSKEGGWLTHLENKAKIGAEQQAKVDTKEQLDVELKKIQKESLEYQKTIREKEEIIRNLEIKLKRIELIKQYRWFIGFILTACIVLGGFLDRLIQMLWPS